MSLTQVLFLSAARDFSPRVSFQGRLSYVCPYAPVCINICVHVKDSVGHVRVCWINETLKHPAHTVGWVARLLQLAFPGESNLNFPWEKSHWDNIVVKKKERSINKSETKLTASVVERDQNIQKGF